MTEIIIGTTPTITYKFKIVSPSNFRTDSNRNSQR